MGATNSMKMSADLSERLILEIPNEIDKAEPLDSQKSVKPRGKLLMQIDRSEKSIRILVCNVRCEEMKTDRKNVLGAKSVDASGLSQSWI